MCTLVRDGTCSTLSLPQMPKFTLTAFIAQSLYNHCLDFMLQFGYNFDCANLILVGIMTVRLGVALFVIASVFCCRQEACHRW